MTEDIDEYDKQLIKYLDDVAKGLEACQKLKGNDRNEKLTQMNDLLERANLALRSFKVELIELPKEEKKKYEAKMQEHKARIDKGYADVKWAKQEGDHAQLMQGAGAMGIEQMSGAQQVAVVTKLQDESLTSLARSKQMVEGAITIGGDTSNTLKAQTEQLKRIDAGIDEVESNLKIADKQIRAFMRRMMSDKIILTFLCLCIVGLVCVIVWSAVDKHAKTNTPDQFKPNS